MNSGAEAAAGNAGTESFCLVDILDAANAPARMSAE